MWYRKECDFKCQKVVKDWEAKILLSCSYLQQWHMYEANEIHASEICAERGCFLASVISVSGYALVTTLKHSKGWSKPKMATESPGHLCQSLAGNFLKRSVRNISNYINFLHFSIVFSEFTCCLCWITNTDEKTKVKPKVWSTVNCLKVGPGTLDSGKFFSQTHLRFALRVRQRPFCCVSTISSTMGPWSMAGASRHCHSTNK